jgi:Carboxypeptidase regulatory-like domain
MQSKFFALICIVLLGFFLNAAFAQRESGAIVGHVTDMESAAVPGAKVTAVTPARGESVTYTDEEGFYRFPVLAPGTYEIKAELEGFQTAVRGDVRLFVGKTSTVDMTISATVQEALVVTGETPLIDATTTASSKTVPVETIENLPKTSFALDLFTLTPGVGDLSYVAYGAGGSQANAYWFDGVDISNPVDGTYWIYRITTGLKKLMLLVLGHQQSMAASQVLSRIRSVVPEAMNFMVCSKLSMKVIP